MPKHTPTYCVKARKVGRGVAGAHGGCNRCVRGDGGGFGDLFLTCFLKPAQTHGVATCGILCFVAGVLRACGSVPDITSLNANRDAEHHPKFARVGPRRRWGAETRDQQEAVCVSGVPWYVSAQNRELWTQICVTSWPGPIRLLHDYDEDCSRTSRHPNADSETASTFSSSSSSYSPRRRGHQENTPQIQKR